MQKVDDFLVIALKTQVFLRDALFSQKKLTTFLVVVLKAYVFTNAQNTSQHFRGKGQVLSKHFIFSKRRLCSSKRGGAVPWHNGQSKPAEMNMF